MAAGRTMLRTVAALTAVGGFAADWNRTHLFNPAWPPHAKFHDAWTVALGGLVGSSSLYYLRDSADVRDTTVGALLPALYWVGQGASFAFPGTAGLEAEFPNLVPRIRGVWINERFAVGLMLALSGVGYALERVNSRRAEAIPAC